jgi:two-component system cell cycle sensor histidine kinase/response regulator CckA
MSDQQGELLESISSDNFDTFDLFDIPIAFANSDKIIIWSTSKFNSFIDDKVKNKDFTKLFNLPEISLDHNTQHIEDTLFFTLYVTNKVKKNREHYYVLFIKEKIQVSEELKNQVNSIKSFAHDINNILTSITNSVSLIKNSKGAEANTKSLLDNIESNAHRAADIIYQVLSDGMDNDSKRRTIDVSQLINELYNSILNIVSTKAVLKIDIEDNLHPIHANYSDIYRILLNLCMNSFESISRKGRITIKACNNNLDSSDGADNSKGNFVELQVIDNGSGIRKKDLKNIFIEGFSTKSKFRDSGLGLHIVKKLIEDHEGKIEVSSKWLRGTTFTILLPAKELNDSSSLLSKDRKTILIADDEESILELLTDLLDSYKYEVICAVNGEEVLKAYRNNSNIDLMIIDRKMPQMDGIECIKNLRYNNYTKPIILTTGSQSTIKDFKAKDILVDKIMIKPYDFEQLLVEVRGLID